MDLLVVKNAREYIKGKNAQVYFNVLLKDYTISSNIINVYN